jgi:DNA polymerase III alpha subunit
VESPNPGERESESLAIRRQLLASLPRHYTQAKSNRALKAIGQRSLFDGLEESEPAIEPGPDPEDPAWTDAYLKIQQRKLLGCYVGMDPLREDSDWLRAFSTHDAAQFGAGLIEGSRVIVGGMVRNPEFKTVKSGRMLRFTLDGLGGSVSAVAWPDVASGLSGRVKDGFVGFAEGRCSRLRDEPDLILDAIIPLRQAPVRLARGYVVRLSAPATSSDFIRLDQIASAHPGSSELWIAEPGRPPSRLGGGFRIRSCNDTIGDLSSTWGRHQLTFVGFRGFAVPKT